MMLYINIYVIKNRRSNKKEKKVPPIPISHPIFKPRNEAGCFHIFLSPPPYQHPDPAKIH